MPHRRKLVWAVWTLVTAPVVAFYFWTATSSAGPFQWRNDKVDSYNLLADGYVAGHLYLKTAPSPEMLALPDPYDAVANAPYRKHDASLYHGRYYLYFGPVPALALFVPGKLILDASPPENFAVAVFVTAGYTFSCLLLVLLLRLAAVRVPLAMMAVAFAGLGLAQFTPILLRRPAMYEIAISAGFCFLMGGLYFLARETPLCSLLAGICLGLAPGCRPHLVLPVVMLCVVFWRRGVLLLAPVAFCGACLAWYNYARFGSIVEFGQSYILTASYQTSHAKLGPQNILPTLKDFLLLPPVKLPEFPFARLRVSFYGEPTAGVAFVMPLCLIGCLAAAYLVCRKRSLGSRAWLILVVLLAVPIPVLGFLCLTGISCLRYQVDYTPALFVAALFALLLLSARAPSRWIRNGVTALVIAGCLWGASMAALLSIDGYASGLEYMNPSAFRALSGWFGNPRRVP